MGQVIYLARPQRGDMLTSFLGFCFGVGIALVIVWGLFALGWL